MIYLIYCVCDFPHTLLLYNVFFSFHAVFAWILKKLGIEINMFLFYALLRSLNNHWGSPENDIYLTSVANKQKDPSAQRKHFNRPTSINIVFYFWICKCPHTISERYPSSPRKTFRSPISHFCCLFSFHLPSVPQSLPATINIFAIFKSRVPFHYFWPLSSSTRKRGSFQRM